jgi:predicted CoA-binding protein
MRNDQTINEDTSPPAVPPVNDPAAVRALLAMRNIAVVGLSDDPGRTSYSVSRYMQQHGYHIIPVNPSIGEALGEKAYSSLADVPGPLELVNVFRRSEFVAQVVDEAIAAGAKGLWLQVGVMDAQAAEKARAAGLLVVMNRCIMVEHASSSR